MTEIASDEDLFVTQSVFKHAEENLNVDVVEQLLFGDAESQQLTVRESPRAKSKRR